MTRTHRVAFGIRYPEAASHTSGTEEDRLRRWAGSQSWLTGRADLQVCAQHDRIKLKIHGENSNSSRRFEQACAGVKVRDSKRTAWTVSGTEGLLLFDGERTRRSPDICPVGVDGQNKEMSYSCLPFAFVQLLLISADLVDAMKSRADT